MILNFIPIPNSNWTNWISYPLVFYSYLNNIKCLLKLSMVCKLPIWTSMFLCVFIHVVYLSQRESVPSVILRLKTPVNTHPQTRVRLHLKWYNSFKQNNLVAPMIIYPISQHKYRMITQRYYLTSDDFYRIYSNVNFIIWRWLNCRHLTKKKLQLIGRVAMLLFFYNRPVCWSLLQY